MAAWVPDIFQNFYVMKTHKPGHNSTNTEAGDIIRKPYNLRIF
jgi:hypothetical protein